MEYVCEPENVCSMEIRFSLEGDVIKNISFVGGCNGNLKAVSRLLEGANVSLISERLLGITCGRRPTSCADQLARAVIKAYEEQKGTEGVLRE